MLNDSKIISIDSNKITFRLDLNIYDMENIVNKYVIFNSDKKFVGEIYSIKENIVESYLLGYIENGKFIYGDLLKPKFDSKISMIAKDELDIIFSEEGTNLVIGHSYIYNDYEIGIDLNKFFSNHFAIFGNTGSGKSYALASIIQKIFYNSERSPFKSNFFIFDVYGEYKNCFTNISKKFPDVNYRIITTDLSSNEEHLNLPFYLLGTDDIALLLEAEEQRQISIINKALNLVSIFAEEKEKVIEYKNDIIARCLLDIIYNNSNLQIRTQIVSVLSKFNTKDIYLDKVLSKGGWNQTLKQCLYINETGKIQDIELVVNYLESFIKNDLNYKKVSKKNNYTIENFYSALEFALISEGILSSDKVYDYANILKVRLDSLIKSKKHYFDYNDNIDKNEYICRLLIDSNNKKYQIINFNINNLDDRFSKVIVKIISKWLFDFATELNPRGKFPIHIILEEAHRYIQNDLDTKVLGYNIFDRITKEGRKYGVVLGVISQRPSELSQVSISQISNFLIFKMFYKDDIEFVSSILPTISGYNIDRLKTLYPGVCMLIGNSFKIPIIIYVDKPNPEPNSSNVDIKEAWYS